MIYLMLSAVIICQTLHKVDGCLAGAPKPIDQSEINAIPYNAIKYHAMEYCQHQRVSFWCPVMMVTTLLDDVSKKWAR